jgi:HEPN domain-containing protein
MSDPPEFVEPIRGWVQSAEGDLATAESVVDEPTVPPWAVCFHAQQCVEKYLKAWLVAEGIPIPRSHDLDELIGLLPGEKQPDIDAAVLEDLTSYATVGRYPGAHVPSREEARAALAAARRIRSTIRARLPSAAIEPRP